MKQFTSKYADQIKGVLSGFDRLVFRGTLLRLTYPEGLQHYLHAANVLLKDFGTHSEQVTQRIKAASVAECKSLDRPLQYLQSPGCSKEDIARQIAVQDGVTDGLICVLSAVEPCQTFEIYRNRDIQRLELVSRRRQCLHLYHYLFHPVFGFMNARLQTWFPFRIQVCINGREWLSRQMDAEGLSYHRQDNCFPWIEDFTRAQQLMDDQLKANWPSLLNGIAQTVNPDLDQVLEQYPASYYWSAHQSEWATDIVFADTAFLRRLYPMLLRHGISTLQSTDVMRFLARRLRGDGSVPARFDAEVVTDLREREEGVRMKHRIDHNSLKVYDKAYTPFGNVLRAEATINDVTDFRVYRPKESDPNRSYAWQALRKGVADIHRRAEVSQRANDRYLDALAAVDDTTTLQEMALQPTAPTTLNGKRVRALNPLASEDLALLQAVARGEFALNGLRNRDLQRLLYRSEPADPVEARRRSACVTRKLRMLRAHGILTKVPHTHRYQVTPAGRTFLTAILTARTTPIRQLLPMAA